MITPTPTSSWDSERYFASLTESNRLASELGMRFCRVSGLEGFEEALAQIQETPAFCCVADSSDGRMTLETTPSVTRVKTVFLALRHALGDMKARTAALARLREVFRQFLSALLREKVRLEQNGIFIDSAIAFHEIGEYFAAGCACAYFQIGVNTAVDLQYNPGEWL